MNATPSEQQIRDAVLASLKGVAPEADAGDIEPDEPLQEQLDIDSIDFLNFLMALHEKTGVDIPERDYGRVATLNDCVSYVAARAA